MERGRLKVIRRHRKAGVASAAGAESEWAIGTARMRSVEGHKTRNTRRPSGLRRTHQSSSSASGAPESVKLYPKKSNQTLPDHDLTKDEHLNRSPLPAQFSHG